jgi:hypothetical protein
LRVTPGEFRQPVLIGGMPQCQDVTRHEYQAHGRDHLAATQDASEDVVSVPPVVGSGRSVILQSNDVEATFLEETIGF